VQRGRTGTRRSEVIGDIQHTVNTPTLALVFLDPQYQRRFRFECTDDRAPETMRDVAAPGDESAGRFLVGPDVMVISYQETDRNTLVDVPTPHSCADAWHALRFEQRAHVHCEWPGLPPRRKSRVWTSNGC